jgi:hypothetical protein
MLLPAFLSAPQHFGNKHRAALGIGEQKANLSKKHLTPSSMPADCISWMNREQTTDASLIAASFATMERVRF